MILTGLVRLGRDAVLRYMPDGTPVANMALAYNYGQKDEAGKRPAQWIEAALWGKRAEALVPHLLKGTALDVVLEDVRIETWSDRDGATRMKLAARVLNVEFAGRAAERAAAPDPAAPPSDKAGGAGGFESDDIPF